MPSLPDALATARRLIQAGDCPQAERLCRQILQVDPRHAEAWFLLGSAAQGLGNQVEAAASFRQALGIRPDYVEAHNCLGIALKAQGQFDAAAACFRRALELRPDFAASANNLGNALKELGRLDEAVASYRRALELRPDYALAASNLGAALIEQGEPAAGVESLQHAVRIAPGAVDALNNLGVALRKLGKLDEAAAQLRQALRLKPDYATAHNNLGAVLLEQGRRDEALACFQTALRIAPQYAEAQVNLADALLALGRRDEALAGYRRALEMQPRTAAAFIGMGNVLMELLRPDEALANYRRALELAPEAPGVHNGLGNALSDLGRLDEALASYERALQLKPDFPEAHSNMGRTWMRLGKLDETMACLERALELDPDSAEAHFNRAYVWLLKGDFERGWPEYEWRWRRKDAPRSPHAQPTWDGSPLDGRTILIAAEQGLGDTLQFIRYAPLVQRSGGRVLVEVPGSLIPLLSGCPGVDRWIAAGSTPPPFDLQVPLLSLPRLFGTPPAPVPAEVPYIVADARLIEQWRRELEPRRGFRVGIAWQVSVHHPDRHRSIPLSAFAPVARLEGVRLFSLQKGPAADPLGAGAVDVPVTDLGSHLDEKSGAFMDTAAVMKNLDLVIACDTAVGHLAGAMGVPVWVALSAAPDWRWMLGREDSPWYPTMRLFRQAELGNWEAVFDRIAAGVAELVAAAPATGPILVEVAPGELLDKISILEIKSERIDDPEKLRHVRAELAALAAVRDRAVGCRTDLEDLAAELKDVNESLWEVEDEIRLCERCQEFGPRFIELARSVYHQNDRRAAIKRRINELLRSKLVEEKAYTPYA